MKISGAIATRGLNPAVPLLAAVVAGGVLVAALLVIHPLGASDGPAIWPLPLIAALAPVGAFCAFRLPLIFPFGLWAALLPFDFLLGNSSTGTITRYVELIAITFIVFRIIVTRRAVAPPKAWTGWFFVVLWMVLTQLWSIGPQKTQIGLFGSVPLFILMSAVACYPIRPVELRGVLIATVIGSVAAALYGLYLYSQGHLGIDGRLTIVSTSGLAVDQNVYASSFLLAVAICLSIATSHRSTIVRLMAGASILTMLAAAFLSGSRGGFIALVVLFAYFMLRIGDRLVLLAIGAGAGCAFVAFPTALLRFTTNERGSEDGSGRTFIWEVGLRALADHFNWLVGAGYGAFPVAYDRALTSVYQRVFEGWDRPAHNVVLGISVELGVFGAAGLMVAWWQTFRQCTSVAKSSPNYSLRVCAEATILALFVNALFIDPLYLKFYWFAFMIPFMLHNVERPSGGAKQHVGLRRFPSALSRGLFVRRLRRS